jgi:hypothetical protein
LSKGSGCRQAVSGKGVGIIMLMRFFALSLIFVVVVIHAVPSSAEVRERPTQYSPRMFYVYPFAYPYAPGERSPYGSTNENLYGQRRVVLSKEDARRILKQYFFGRNVIVGLILERKFYFEAEIRNKRGDLLDIVLIDKRTGRIRSIY